MQFYAWPISHPTLLTFIVTNWTNMWIPNGIRCLSGCAPNALLMSNYVIHRNFSRENLFLNLVLKFWPPQSPPPPYTPPSTLLHLSIWPLSRPTPHPLLDPLLPICSPPPLMLASLTEPLLAITKPTARDFFESNSPDVSRLTLYIIWTNLCSLYG